MEALPPVIRIEPASACNLRCRHCPTGVTAMRRGLMSDALFKKILREISKNIPPLRVAVLYHGGEPLLNPRLPEMISDLKAVGMPQVKLVTNGMYLTGDLVERIVSSGLDHIEVSLDGESAEESDDVRIRSSAKLILSNIINLTDTI